MLTRSKCKRGLYEFHGEFALVGRIWFSLGLDFDYEDNQERK